MFSLCVRVLLALLGTLALFLAWPSALESHKFAAAPPASLAGIESRRVTVNGIALQTYRAGGDAPRVLLFLHGFPEAGERMWHKQLT